MQKDKLNVKIFQTRDEMRKIAAQDISAALKKLMEEKEEVNVVFAAAPSQNDVLNYLVGCDVTWDRVNAFHMDEHIGLDSSAPQLYCIVPAITKANAVKSTLNDPVSEACPATVMRAHPNATLYLDGASAFLLD